MPPDALVVATVLLLYAAVVISPGPNFALISRLAISGAARTAIGATVGLACAATVYAVLSMSGLALLLMQIGWLAGLVQFAGGAFLIYLGIMSWRRSAKSADIDGPRPARDGFGRGLRLGLLVNLGNPKAIAFFVSLYVATIPPGTSSLARLTILAGGFVLEIVWYGLVVWLLSTAPARAAYKRCGVWIERVLGTLLVLFGIRLITERRA
jgi:threonine/homoserine/homoserine lactone efflux protein